MGDLTDPTRQGPKCPKCGIVAIKLLKVKRRLKWTKDGKVIKREVVEEEMCRHCKKKHRERLRKLLKE